MNNKEIQEVVMTRYDNFAETGGNPESC